MPCAGMRRSPAADSGLEWSAGGSPTWVSQTLWVRPCPAALHGPTRRGLWIKPRWRREAEGDVSTDSAAASGTALPTQTSDALHRGSAAPQAAGLSGASKALTGPCAAPVRHPLCFSPPHVLRTAPRE